MTLTEIAIKRPAGITMFFIAIVVLGFISYNRLPVDLLPAMNWPWVSIVTVWPGAGPKEVETMVSKPIEDAVVSLNKLKHIRTFNRENASVVILEFDMSANSDVVLQETQRMINATRASLPNDAKEPQLYKSDLGALPILRIAASSPLPNTDLNTLINQKIRPRLEQIEGVGQITVSGAEEREIQIAIDPDKLKTHGLSLDDVNRTLASENLDIPAGKIYGNSQDFTIRFTGKYKTLDEINLTRLPLPTGGAIFLRDVAIVYDTIKAERSIARLNGKPALGLQIIKQAQANSVKTSVLVRKELTRLETEYKGLIKFEVAQDITVFNRHSISEVQQNIFEALIVVALVLLVFLHSLRNSLIVLVAIPISIISTFISMALFGFTINLMTMMALGMVIGVLVDDSIVVLENIHRWLKNGADPVTAAIKGRNEIALAAVSITLVDVVTFMPVAFLGGIVGFIFREFSGVFVTAVLMSLLISFTLTPLLASRLNSSRNLEGEKWIHRFAMWFEVKFKATEEYYRRVLNWSLNHRGRVILIVTGLMILSIALVPLGFVGADFIPKTDRGEFSVLTKMPLGTPLEENNATLAKIEDYIKQQPETDQVYTVVGLQESGMGVETNPRLGNIQVKLKPRKERKRPSIVVENAIRRYAQQIPGMEAEINEIGLFGMADDAPIQYEVRGQDLDSVEVAVEHVIKVMHRTPGARDIKSSYDLGSPELQVVVDREKVATSYLTPGEVAMALRNAINGAELTKFRTGEVDVDMRSLLVPRYRNDPSLLGQIEIKNHLGQMVKLSEVATIQRNSGPSGIQRKDRERYVTVSANIYGHALSEVQGAFDKEMKKYKPPQGVSFYAFGEVENMREMMSDMIIAIMLSVLFIYMILVTLYESYVHPFTVMFSVPVALIGALFGLALTGYSLSMMSMIGLLILMGLVTKNGILLVDFTIMLREKGMSMKEALLIAGPLRLRPILMTTSTMVLGMIPLALALGEGADMRAGMGVVIIGGLISSLLLTLVLVPVMFTFLDRFTKKREPVPASEAVRENELELGYISSVVTVNPKQ